MNLPAFQHSRLLGVSLKMYMDRARTRQWLSDVAALARRGETNGVELFVIPDFLSLDAASSILEETPVRLGAQDVFWHASGAYTGEISAPMLAQAGCRYVEVGHAERRRLFGETDATTAAKAAAAARAGLIPVICIGELEHIDPPQAVAFCASQLKEVFAQMPADAPLVVAYEPVWAIGVSEPAEPDYIRAVSHGLRELLTHRPARLIYGGSAGPGLFTRLQHAVDGLFLGRFAHDPAALAAVMAEMREMANDAND